jgi:general secretion pathway protein D
MSLVPSNSVKSLTLCLALAIGAASRGFGADDAVETPGALAQNAPTPSNQPSGLLTPPPDTTPTAPAATPPADNSTATPPAVVPPAGAPAPAPDGSAPATIPDTTPTKPTAHDIAQIRREEIVRRQELIYRADETLKDARKAEVGSNYPEARKDYLFCAEAYGTVSRSTKSYSAAAEGLTRVDFHLYDDALSLGDTARAKLLIEEVIKYNPNDKEANKRMAAINRALNNPNDTATLGNPAVTPRFIEKVNRVQQLFAEAEQFRRTGQWDEAEARLREILGIDAYNIAATKQLERIDAEKLQYDEHARIETRDEMLRQVEEKWFENITNKEDVGLAQNGQATLTRETNFTLEQLLKNTFLSLDFHDATIEEATNYLSIESKRLDPNKKGVNFIIQPEASTTAKPVTITLNNVPLGEALRYVCQLAGVKFKVQDYAISIVPFTAPTDDLISRSFNVQPNFVTTPHSGTVFSPNGDIGGVGTTRPLPTDPNAPPPPEAAGDTVRAALEAKGIKFPPGASAVYTPSTGQLTVVNTPDQMELLEELVNAGQAPTLMVRIATKFVEINQTDLQDLTFNTGFNYYNTTGVPVTTFSVPSFSTALPGSLGFPSNSIGALITPKSVSLNTLQLNPIIFGTSQLNFVVTALSQKKSFDLLSEPAVLTKSGEQGVLESVRVFPYPISFDPPQLQSETSETNGTTVTTVLTLSTPTVIATTPTDFKRRNIGVRLVVKPQVTSDNQTVDLSLFPEVVDFEGFINYGDEIFVANPDGTQSLLSPNEINQPVFNTRRINTKVLIRDGSTVVMGGLIRDDVQTINDKVPGLGDLPLIGRLFQSKATTNTKRNLLIFVTANIYRNDGELLNPPEEDKAVDVLTSRTGYTPVTTP